MMLDKFMISATAAALAVGVGTMLWAAVKLLSINGPWFVITL